MKSFNALLAILIITFASINKTSFAEEPEILFGSVAMDIPAVMHKRLTPLTRYLGDALGRPVALKLSPNMGAAIREAAEGTVDIAYLTPVAYIKARKKGGARIVVKTVTRGKASFRLMIVVKEDSPIKTVSDLAGKTFAFGDKRALLQRASVVGSGIRLEDLSSYEFLGHYDNIAHAVYNGDFDAGILKDTMVYKWEGKGLRVLYSSPDLPPYNIVVSSRVDDKLLMKLRQAFLSLDGKNPEHLKIIKALDKKYDGFAETSDEEYDVVRDLIKPFVK